MGTEEHKCHADKEKHSYGFAIVVTSDSRTFEDDKSGKVAIELLEKEGHKKEVYEIIKNDMNAIHNLVKQILENEKVDFIITSGGTGCGKKDLTIEAVSSLYQKHLPGFGELFRHFSIDEIGSAAFMSRASLGLVAGKPVFSVPGSTGAIKLALNKLIIPELSHIIWEAKR